jgi:DNA ligase-associated metallophosphoesterase
MLEKVVARDEAGVTEVAGASLVVDPAGAIWWAAERLLVVADLHLEKGSAFAARGRLLPPYDTAATLQRLAVLCARYLPRAVIALGDSFHDRRASDRIDAASVDLLADLARGRDWIWITGNHDPEPQVCVTGEWLQELRLGPLTFRHEPQSASAPGEIAGHLHPVAKVHVRGRALRRRCLATDGARAVLPAFGAYAGGLNLCDEAFLPIFPARAVTAWMLGGERAYPVAGVQLIPDMRRSGPGRWV